MKYFFVKQKTAYEMRISDWSSDVCSSDLATMRGGQPASVLRELTPRSSRGQALCATDGTSSRNGACPHRAPPGADRRFVVERCARERKPTINASSGSPTGWAPTRALHGASVGAHPVSDKRHNFATRWSPTDRKSTRLNSSH